jgi:histidinol-phosphate aminotransferase
MHTARHMVRHTASADLAHHGDADLAPGLVDLAVNVQLPEPPAWLRDEIAASLRDLGSYPRPEPARVAVAARHRRDATEVLLTNGAAEAFVLIARVLRPRRPVVVHPQFTVPELALRAAGHHVERLQLTAEDGFRLDPRALADDADLVVLGNPTNPTSVLHPAAAVASLARPGRVLVVDEAFMDAVPGEPESLAETRDLPGVLVVRTVTKTWGLAGLRVGYTLGPAALIARMAEGQPPWAVSTPALAAARACARPGAVAEAARAAGDTVRHRDYLVRGLRRLPGLAVPGDPRAPFVLVRVPAGERVRLALRDRGFAVRRGDTFPGLGPDYLRIAVRPPDVTDRLVAALTDVLPAPAEAAPAEAAPAEAAP